MKNYKITLLLILLGVVFLNYNFEEKKVATSNEIILQDSELGDVYDKFLVFELEDRVILKDYFKSSEIIEVATTKGTILSRVGEGYIFKLENLLGVMDENLNTIIPPIYEDILKTDKSPLFLVKKDGVYGYLDREGTVLIPFEYEMGAHEKNGLITVKKDGKIGVINSKNREILKFEYDAIYYEDGERFIVLKDKGYYLLDRENELQRLDVTWMGVQNGNTLLYERDGRFGIFNLERGYITKNLYTQLSQNYTNLIIAMKDKKYGVISVNGEVMYPFRDDIYILPMGKNYLKIGEDKTGKMFLMNQMGMIVTKKAYDDFIEINERNIIGIDEGRKVLIDSDGEEIEKIDSIIGYSERLLLYRRDNINILRKL